MKSKPKYAGLGIALGAALGAVAGVMAGNMGGWLALGVAIGVAIGWSARPKTSECQVCEALHRTHRLRSGADSPIDGKSGAGSWKLKERSSPWHY